MAAEPEEYLRGTVAHEAGHVALGHQRAAHAEWVFGVGGPLWAAAIGCCVVGVQHSSTQQTSLWFAFGLVPALLALRLIVIPSRRSELAADQWSADLVGTQTVLRTLQHLDEQCTALRRIVAVLGMDTHPSRGREHADSAVDSTSPSAPLQFTNDVTCWEASTADAHEMAAASPAELTTVIAPPSC